MQQYFYDTIHQKDDKQLIDEALGGSKTALELLLKRHYSFIYNVALRFLLSPQDAEDLTQEVVIKVITKLSTFNQGANFQTWLYRIVFNHFLNTKRNDMENVISSFEAYGNQLDNIPFQELTKEEEISYHEMIEDAKLGCMTGMLICLGRKQRLVFILGEIFEIDSQIGSKLLEISAANFRKILSRARKDLYGFMNNKCGLINKNNPCRCPKKTKGFIAEGWVNKEDLQFNNHFLKRIEEIAKHKVNECDSLIDEQYAALFKSHPYYDKNKAEDLVNNLTSDKNLKRIFDL